MAGRLQYLTGPLDASVVSVTMCLDRSGVGVGVRVRWGQREWVMKAMDELVEGEEELVFRGEKATGIFFFFFLVSLLFGLRSHTSQFSSNCAACVLNSACRSLCLFSSM